MALWDAIETIEPLPPLPTREPDAHKGDFGRVLVVAGSGGMIGAAALCANSALRGGAGLVTAAAPACVQQAVATLCPSALTLALPDEGGALAPAAVGAVSAAAGKADVVAAGPGLTVALGPQMVVQTLLGHDRPMVLDADGLNNLARIDDWAAQRRCPLVLTPHPGEMARLVGKPIAEIQSDRTAAAVAAAREWVDSQASPDQPLVLVLKGAGTVVTDGRRVYVNATGNPGMATGGSGDVLTGLVAALIGQGMTPFDAAVTGSYVHGLAGDLAAKKLGPISLTACDLSDHLAPAMMQTGQQP